VKIKSSERKHDQGSPQKLISKKHSAHEKLNEYERQDLIFEVCIGALFNAKRVQCLRAMALQLKSLSLVLQAR
jgi:hypothetical protein